MILPVIPKKIYAISPEAGNKKEYFNLMWWEMAEEKNQGDFVFDKYLTFNYKFCI